MLFVRIPLPSNENHSAYIAHVEDIVGNIVKAFWRWLDHYPMEKMHGEWNLDNEKYFLVCPD